MFFSIYKNSSTDTQKKDVLRNESRQQRRDDERANETKQSNVNDHERPQKKFFWGTTQKKKHKHTKN